MFISYPELSFTFPMNLFNCLYISLMLLLVILFLQLLYLCILSSYHFSIFWEPTGIVILLLFLYFSQVLLSSDCNSIAVYRRISCPVQSSFLTIYLLSFFITCFVFFLFVYIRYVNLKVCPSSYLRFVWIDCVAN